MLRLILSCIALLPFVGQAAQHVSGTWEYSFVPLLAGSRPEGVTVGISNDLWVACLSGEILHVDLANNKTTQVHTEPGVALSGAKFCKKQQILFAAGSLSGQGFIYHMQHGNSSSSSSSSASGQQEYIVTKREVVKLYNKPGLAYINDVAISQDRVYFTDSFHAVIYSIERHRDAASSGHVHVLQHSTGRYFDTQLGQFRANGLAVQSSTSSTDTLVVANTHTGNLYRVLIDKAADVVKEEPKWHQQQQVHVPSDMTAVSPARQTSSTLGINNVNMVKPFPSPASGRQTVVGHQAAAVQELVLPKVTGKLTDTLLLDGVWFVNSTFALVADNFNNRVWGIKLRADASGAEIACLMQLPIFKVPTTITSLDEKIYIINAHLDTCFPFLPCPLHRFEVVGTDMSQCRSWP